MLYMDTHMHTYIDTYKREGLLNPGTVERKETLCYFRLEHTLGHGVAKRVPLLPYQVNDQSRWGSVGPKETHLYLT